jgi:hypothetical protein
MGEKLGLGGPLKEGHRKQNCDNRVVRGMFKPLKEEATGC